jgi:cytidyltransferase-like protein
MAKTKTLVIASGYFNPIHEGHIEYLNRSKAIGDFLFVIVNNDTQRKMKGSKPFMTEEQRLCVVSNLKSVDAAMISIDKNNRLVENSIQKIYNEIGSQFDKIIFTNGGDVIEETVGEWAICKSLGIQLIFGLGDKTQSSSELLKNQI